MLGRRSRVASVLAFATAMLAWVGCNAIAGIDEGALLEGPAKPGAQVQNGESGASSTSSGASTSSGSSTSSSTSSGSSTSSSSSSSASSSTGGPTGSCNGLPTYAFDDVSVMPAILDSHLNGPMGVASDGTRVVYTISGQTTAQLCGSLRVIDGTGVHQIAASEQFPTAVFLSGTFAYFTMTTLADPTYSNVRRASVLSTSSAPVAALRVQPTSIRLQSNIAYWTDKAGLFSCDMNNGTSCGSSPDTVVSRSYAGRGLVASSTRLAWIENGSIYACNRLDCAASVVTLASGQTNPREMALDGSTVYWTEDGSNDNAGNVWSTSVDAPGTVTPILCGLAHPQGIVVDGASVYVANRGTSPDFLDGTVIKCAKTGCANRPQLVAKGQTQPYGMAVDSTKLYWTTIGIQTGAGSACNASLATGTIAATPK